MDERHKPRVSVRSLGGTVAMTTSTDSAPGAVPTLDADGLVAALPQLAEIASIDAASLASVPGASLTLEDLLTHLKDLEAACAAGADGIVITTGTDTMEEVGYLFDLLWGGPEPIVLTGAMRTADTPGADGPANLFAAVTVAAAPAARGRGSMVVMNDEVHQARAVRKTHTSSPAAFQSLDGGPIGRVHEGVAMLGPPAPRLDAFALPDVSQLPRVALVRVALGDDTRILERAATEYDGVVVESTGGGHVPSWWVAPLLAAAERIPVVLASRTGSGPMLRDTYGFTGSERQLLNGGLVSAGVLDGLKARILLVVALMTTSDPIELAEIISRRSSLI